MDNELLLRCHPGVMQLRKTLQRCHVTTGHLFSCMDASRGGEVSFREFARGLAMANVRPLPTMAELQVLFDTMDLDSSGDIGYNELRIILEGDAEAVARATKISQEAGGSRQRFLIAGQGHGGTTSPRESKGLRRGWGYSTQTETNAALRYGPSIDSDLDEQKVPLPPPPPSSFKQEILAYHSEEIAYNKRRQELMRKAGTPPEPRPIRKRDSGTLGLGAQPIPPHSIGESSLAWHGQQYEEGQGQSSFRGGWRK